MDLILSLLKQRPREDWQWTLDTQRRDWCRGNALAMANCALLAYSDATEISRHLTQRGFAQVIPCSGRTNGVDTQAFVAIRADAVVVAFRGTEPTNLTDFATGFDVAQAGFEKRLAHTGWGRVHDGFAHGLAAVLDQVMTALASFDDGAHTLWMTGHSLGGAIAMLAAAFIAEIEDHPIDGVYTFGQPHVGDPTFRQRYDSRLRDRTFRVVNDRDLVPHVVPAQLTREETLVVTPGPLRRLVDLVSATGRGAAVVERYEHAGQLRLLLPGGGGLSENSADEAVREPSFLKGTRNAASYFRDLPLLLLGAPLLISDHAPIHAPLTDGGYIEHIEALPDR